MTKHVFNKETVMKNIIFAVVLLSLLAGCAHNGKEKEEDYEQRNKAMLNGLIGSPIGDLVDRVGYPDEQFLAPSGNVVYMYSLSNTTTTPVTARTYRYDYIPDTTLYSGGETITYWCKIFFEVGQDKKVLRWRLKGNRCY